jgi:hypothetical protein
MNDLVRRYIKTAFFFLLLGLLLGGWMLVQRELYGIWPPPYVIAAHKHVVFVGFVMFMILGVALWLFPKALPDDPRYRTGLIEVVYWLLFCGTLARFAGDLLRAYRDGPWLGWLVVLAGFAQVASLLLYVWTIWHRIRPTKRELRDRRNAAGSDTE